ncbi:MAG: hypothetical protein ACK5MT_15640 [Actinomycetales bacterium]
MKRTSVSVLPGIVVLTAGVMMSAPASAATSAPAIAAETATASVSESLEAYPGLRVAGAAQDHADVVEQLAAVEQLVRECMAAQGLAYTPQVAGQASPTANDEQVAAMASQQERDRWWIAYVGSPQQVAASAAAAPAGGCLASSMSRVDSVFAIKNELRADLDALTSQPGWAQDAAAQAEFITRHRASLQDHAARQEAQRAWVAELAAKATT